MTDAAVKVLALLLFLNLLVMCSRILQYMVCSVGFPVAPMVSNSCGCWSNPFCSQLIHQVVFT